MQRKLRSGGSFYFERHVRLLRSARTERSTAGHPRRVRVRRARLVGGGRPGQPHGKKPATPRRTLKIPGGRRQRGRAAYACGARYFTRTRPASCRTQRPRGGAEAGAGNSRRSPAVQIVELHRAPGSRRRLKDSSLSLSAKAAPSDRPVTAKAMKAASTSRTQAAVTALPRSFLGLRTTSTPIVGSRRSCKHARAGISTSAGSPAPPRLLPLHQHRQSG